MYAYVIMGLFLYPFLVFGCASLSQERSLICPYDTTWQAAIETMRDRPLLTVDKEKGLIETRWTEFDGPDRRFGILQRAAFDNKARSSMTVILKPKDNTTHVSVSERREVWHARGGATSGATRWWPVEPSEEAMASVLQRIDSKLKDKGCSAS